MTHEPTWLQELPHLLDEARPDRYTPGVDADWQQSIIEEQAQKVPIAEAQEYLVRAAIERLERRAMKRGRWLRSVDSH